MSIPHLILHERMQHIVQNAEKADNVIKIAAERFGEVYKKDTAGNFLEKIDLFLSSSEFPDVIRQTIKKQAIRAVENEDDNEHWQVLVTTLITLFQSEDVGASAAREG